MITAYLINLPRRSDRKAKFLKKNAPILPFLDVQFIEAVDGTELKLSELTPRIGRWNLENMNERKLRGYLGNGLSHLNCLELIARSNRPGLVFEDDAVLFNSGSARLLRNLLSSNLPEDLVWLTNWARGASLVDRYLTRASILASPILTKPILSPWNAQFEKTTEAYIISAHYAAIIAEKYRNNLGAFDEHIRGYTHDLNARAFYCRPALFRQDDRTDSDVAKLV
jgi:GR25 family glycosyltransferase involved in LPS biosynthesis